MAVVGGLLYGRCISKYEFIPTMSLGALAGEVQKTKPNSRIDKIDYAAWVGERDRDFPHFIVNMRNPSSRFIVRNPSPQHVKTILKWARVRGVDFTYKEFSRHTLVVESWEFPLIENAVPTEAYAVSMKGERLVANSGPSKIRQYSIFENIDDFVEYSYSAIGN